eukprot:gnl/MRDRNA2_/MRDRNA2_96053_c0_seq1.p1 gnl/MRDRNA2_/MRDRNA2_96053_c0~~gnl/MRDRNA2_/MRDRNA2_96053_c0_seq1.p1  ORF type:complete len:611 (-),score=97.59 gnl/MRDRNA2_/MRDRNA2_96053_c0_seq1:69-1901(-)
MSNRWNPEYLEDRGEPAPKRCKDWNWGASKLTWDDIDWHEAWRSRESDDGHWDFTWDAGRWRETCSNGWSEQWRRSDANRCSKLPGSKTDRQWKESESEENGWQWKESESDENRWYDLFDRVDADCWSNPDESAWCTLSDGTGGRRWRAPDENRWNDMDERSRVWSNAAKWETEWVNSEWETSWSMSNAEWDDYLRNWKPKERESPPACVCFVVELTLPPRSGRFWRVRISGTGDALGDWGEYKEGIDLFPEDEVRWTSLVKEVPAGVPIKYQVTYQLEGSCMGDDWWWQGEHQCGICRSVIPRAGFVAKVMHKGVNEVPMTEFVDRKDFLAEQKRARHPGGTQRWCTWDAPNGVTLQYSLFLPVGHQGRRTCTASRSDCGRWPLLVFLHAMHYEMDSNMCNLFHDGCSPPSLLYHNSAPSELTQFVVLCPHCPEDPLRGDGIGLWLRSGPRFERSDYSQEMENALDALTEDVCQAYSIDRDRVSLIGCSMGGYACLELSKRWPDRFAAVSPVAAHYEFDLEALAEALAATRISFWFFHASNDEICPFEPIERLVRMIRAKRQAMHEQPEICFTSGEDTWSMNGHNYDEVAYKRLGNKLFGWLLSQRRHR